MFKPAVKSESKLRLALVGPSGSGKTYSALAIASALGQKVAVVDTERGSASKYADLFTFDVMTPESFEPEVVVKAAKEAAAAGYDVLVVDSLSHFWMGEGGALDQVDRVAKRSRTENSFAAWKDVTPRQNAMVGALVGAALHVVVTMRTKTEWVIEQQQRGDRTINVPKKVGLAPVQRAGLEYEFDLVADMDEATMVVSKSRCPALAGKVIREPGADVAEILRAWLHGAPVDPEQAAKDAESAELVSSALTDELVGLYQTCGSRMELQRITKLAKESAPKLSDAQRGRLSLAAQAAKAALPEESAA